MATQYMPRGKHTQAHMARDFYASLFQPDGSISGHHFTNAKKFLGSLELHELAELRDLDHYNIFEKAVVFDCQELMSFLLTLISPQLKHEFVSIYLSESFHTACFLGCKDIVELLVERFPLLGEKKAMVSTRPASGTSASRLKDADSLTKTSNQSLANKWILQNQDNLAIEFATSNDQVEVVRYLWERFEERGNYPEKNMMDRLFQIACMCNSIKCMDFIAPLLLQEVMTSPEHKGRALLEKGLSFGFTFVETMKNAGITKDMLNNLDGKGSLNALHVFYFGLKGKGHSSIKYKDIYKTTSSLIDMGVDVNLQTCEYKRSEETILEILLSHINLIVDAGDKSNRNKTKKSKSDLESTSPQESFDNIMYSTVVLILNSGYNIEKYGSRVLGKLFENKNYLLRFSLRNTSPYLSRRAWGLGNIEQIASLLISKIPSLRYAENQITPLISLIDGLWLPVTPFELFFSGDFRASMCKCITMLIEKGVDPNLYPIHVSENSKYAAPVIHLMDIFALHWKDGDYKKLDDKCLDGLCEVISHFVEKGVMVDCNMNINNVLVGHSILDSVFLCALLDPTRSVEYQVRTTEMIVNITCAILNLGVPQKLGDYVTWRMSHGFMVNTSPIQSSLLYSWIKIGLNLEQVGCYPMSINAYRKLSNLLMNTAEHSVYYMMLSDGLKDILGDSSHLPTEEPQEDSYLNDLHRMGMSPRSLKTMSRLKIKMYVEDEASLAQLPLPSPLQDYLFDMSEN